MERIMSSIINKFSKYIFILISVYTSTGASEEASELINNETNIHNNSKESLLRSPEVEVNKTRVLDQQDNDEEEVDIDWRKKAQEISNILDIEGLYQKDYLQNRLY